MEKRLHDCFDLARERKRIHSETQRYERRFGRSISAVRRRQGLTVEQLATKTRLTTAVLKQVESGEVEGFEKISLPEVLSIAKALSLSYTRLMALLDGKPLK